MEVTPALPLGQVRAQRTSRIPQLPTICTALPQQVCAAPSLP